MRGASWGCVTVENGANPQTLPDVDVRGDASPDNTVDHHHLVRVLGSWEAMPVFGTRDQRIAQIAAAQRGRIATRQLTAAGVGSNAVTHRVRTGRLFRIHHGVLAVGHPGPVALGRETAALLAVGGDAALTL